MTEHNYSQGEIAWQAIVKLDKDLKEAAQTMTRADARTLINIFYDIQHVRIRLSNQVDAAIDNGRPCDLLKWALKNEEVYERNCLNSLQIWTRKHPITKRWVEQLYGVGPITCAGMIAYLDEKPPPTVGHWWSFAGMQPNTKALTNDKATELIKKELGKASGPVTIEQATSICQSLYRKSDSVIHFAMFDKEGKERPLTVASLATALARRPWNARLKTLLWKFASTQVRLHARSKGKGAYGTLYYTRKAYEIAKNEAGDYAETAATILKEKNYKKTTDAYKAYIQGKLPDAHIHARCLRWVAKVFVAHWHQVSFNLEYGVDPPRPWIIEHGGHDHYIDPPGWDG
jgi:hypothetical protein